MVWRVADPMGVDQVSKVSEHLKMGEDSKLNILHWHWLTGFHLLHHTDTGLWPDRAGSWCVSEMRSR